MDRLRITGLISACVAIAVMFELIRRQNIKEKYTVLWLATAAAMLALAGYPRGIDGLADLLGIRSGPNVLILLGGLAVTVVCVHLSVEISRLEDRTRGLAEELGLLRLELAKRIESSTMQPGSVEPSSTPRRD